MTGSATVVSGSAPAAFALTGGGYYCMGGAGEYIGLSNSQTGVTYQLYRGGAIVGPAIAGSNGSSIDFGTLLQAGTYTVLATNTSTGCTNNMLNPVSITVGTPPTVTVNSTGICANGAGAIIAASPSPAGSYNYAWTVPAGASDPGNVASFSATVAGSYSVTITNTYGCSGTGTGTLTVYPAPTVTVNSPTICAGASAMIMATGTPAGIYSYSWTVPAGASNPGNIASFSATVAGSYSVTITNINGCSATGAGTLTVNPTPTVTVNSPTICPGSSALITASPVPAGSYSYAWTVPAGAGNPGNVASFTATVAGVYSVIISNGSGCSGTGSGSLTVNSALTVSVNSASRCTSGPGVAITATPSPAGSYNYAWTVPAGAANPGNVPTFTATTAGTYGVTISNVGGCTATGSGILTVTSAPTVAVNSGTRCSTGPAVTITATPSPAGSYTYAWTVPAGASNPGNVASFSATVAGTYGVTISNGGCTATGSGTLTVSSTLPIVQAITGTSTVCTATIRNYLTRHQAEYGAAAIVW